ncbi:MAG: ferritin-like domain-containing protein [Rudaea sp.]
MGAGNPARIEQANLFALARHCLDLTDPLVKCAATAQAAATVAAGGWTTSDHEEPPLPIGAPGRPARPRLVSARDLPRRGLGTVEGRIALIHAVAHIEFNAINLAWDAVYRFRGMPSEYYRDWIGVASDEARHFSLLQARLTELGHAYGDFDAHDGLWEMAVKTAHSCLSRMALVPRVLEARGLDVTPGMIARLRAVGDLRTVEILETILREEIAHVAAGSRWFAWCCAREHCEPDATFAALIDRHAPGALKGPFNTHARLAAGFSIAEMARIEALE